MVLLDPGMAFDQAIAAGILSLDRWAITYAGQYMYMGTDATRGHAFKNIDTRAYLYMHDDGHATTRLRSAMRETVGR
jgi:hypothetical protein